MLAPHATSFFSKLKRFTHFYRRFCIRRACSNKKHREEFWSFLDKKTCELQLSLSSLELQDEVNKMHSNLMDFEDTKLEV